MEQPMNISSTVPNTGSLGADRSNATAAVSGTGPDRSVGAHGCPRTARDSVLQFLNGETRQVWARDRATGVPVFIGEGMAGVLRQRARTEWSCIVPGCDSPISTRGGSKRDHFFHLTGVEHEGGAESQNHLAGKAMLARWASEEVAGAATVVEEQTVKNPESQIHRRPDVMITWHGSDDRVAFEVEYKSFDESAWAAKQRDLDHEAIRCVWLVGHTRIGLIAPARPHRGPGHYLRVSRFCRALSRAGRHVLIINPVTRQIGTLAGDDDLTSRSNPNTAHAYLGVDDLDDCDLDPGLGIITPTMRLIDTAQAEAAQRRAVRERREVEARTRQAELEEARQAARRRRDDWLHSSLRTRLLSRWGHVPKVLAEQHLGSAYVHADIEHWHAVIYETQIHSTELGSVFTADDCWSALNQHGIAASSNPAHRIRAMESFLSTLQRHGLITRVGRSRWRVRTSIDVMISRQRAAEQAAYDAQRVRQREHLAEERAIAQIAEDRQKARRDRITAQDTAWKQSTTYRHVRDRYGEVPRCISWPNTYLTEAIAVPPALWRALICLRLIADAPAGTTFTVHNARDLLRKEGVPFDAPRASVDAAVAHYLYNLCQRGILARSEPTYQTTGHDLLSHRVSDRDRHHAQQHELVFVDGSSDRSDHCDRRPD